MILKPYRLGADISFWVDDDETPQMTNFTQMRDAGVEFIFIRAGQNLWRDTDFSENWRRSRDILPRGAYWFYDDRIDPNMQAELFYKILQATGDLGELPLVVDYETTPKVGGGDGAYVGWKYFYTMLAKCQDYMPEKKIIIYTGYWFWKDHAPSPLFNSENLAWFGQFDLWIAAYNERPVEEQRIPKPWDKALLWQFTESGDGHRYGTESKGIDLNYFLGDDVQWTEFIGEFAEDEPTVPTEVHEEDYILQPEREAASTTALSTSIDGVFTLQDGVVLSFSPSNPSDDPPDDPPDDPEDLPILPLPIDSQTYIVPEDDEIYYQMRHDYENVYWEFTPRSIVKDYKNPKYAPAYALPETVQFQRDEFFPLQRDMQFLWKALCDRAAGGYMTEAERMEAWLSLTANHRALTDAHSANEDGFIDYVGGINLDDRYHRGPMMQKALGFGGGIVRQVRDLGTKIEIEAIDPEKPAPHINDIWGKWHLVGWATQETVTELPGGRYRVSPFPQIRQHGPDGYRWKTGTPYMLIGRNGIQTIDKFRLKVIANGDVYSPHVRN